jgi:hypothetical protein
MNPVLIRSSFLHCGFQLTQNMPGLSNEALFDRFINRLNSALKSILNWESSDWDKAEELLSPLKLSLISYKHCSEFQDNEFLQPYAEPATETFPHHWEAILLSSQALDTGPEEFLPKSFYKNETPEDKLKRWTLVLSTVGLILDGDDDEFMELDEEFEEEIDEDEAVDEDEAIDEASLSNEDNVLNLLLDLEINTLLELF